MLPLYFIVHRKWLPGRIFSFAVQPRWESGKCSVYLHSKISPTSMAFWHDDTLVFTFGHLRLFFSACRFSDSAFCSPALLALALHCCAFLLLVLDVDFDSFHCPCWTRPSYLLLSSCWKLLLLSSPSVCRRASTSFPSHLWHL